MCVNCISHAEFVVANVALVGSIVKDPAHRIAADLGLVAPPDPVKRDVTTVSFLRRLELDPVEILGAGAVARADERVLHPELAPQACPGWRRATQSTAPALLGA